MTVDDALELEAVGDSTQRLPPGVECRNRGIVAWTTNKRGSLRSIRYRRMLSIRHRRMPSSDA